MNIKIAAIVLLILMTAQTGFAADLQNTPTNSNHLIISAQPRIFDSEIFPLDHFEYQIEATSSVAPMVRKESSLDHLMRTFEAESVLRRSA